jgi:hypothetical protein
MSRRLTIALLMPLLAMVWTVGAEGRKIRITCIDGQTTAKVRGRLNQGPPPTRRIEFCPFERLGDGKCTFSFCPSLEFSVGCLLAPVCTQPVGPCVREEEESETFAVALRGPGLRRGGRLVVFNEGHTEIILRCRPTRGGGRAAYGAPEGGRGVWVP